VLHYQLLTSIRSAKRRPFCPAYGRVGQPVPVREMRWFSRVAKSGQAEAIWGESSKVRGWYRRRKPW